MMAKKDNQTNSKDSFSESNTKSYESFLKSRINEDAKCVSPARLPRQIPSYLYNKDRD